MWTASRILVPVDFQKSSRAALACASSLAMRLDAQVDALHVWQAPTPIAFEGQWVPPLSAFAKSEAGRAMKELLESIEDPDGRLHGRLATGDPVETILDVIAEENYDLVVMGRHGKRRLSHLLMGGVAERVVRRAACPVLVVHEGENLVHIPEQKGGGHAQASPPR